MDDTRVKKSGRKVYGAKYTRDPLGPPFHTNFIRAQRFLQISMACKGADRQARMIPIDWKHAPTPPKPKKTASPDQWDEYRKQSRRCRISGVGAKRLQRMRRWLDQHGARDRRLWTAVDNTFTNRTVLKSLPENTTLVGRMRSDAKLHYLPEAQPGALGRRRVYGAPAPTPQEFGHDDTRPWQTVHVFFGGKKRQIRAKEVGPLRWRPAGPRNLKLIVVGPIPYRVTPKGKVLYRKWAYLICTDPEASLTEIIQHYVWRWDIEVNFRDEKTLLGVGEAQVRTPEAVENVTATAVAAYAMLLVAAERCRQDNVSPQHLPAPKWHRFTSHRATTSRLIQNLRYELWSQSIHFSGFVVGNHSHTKPQKCRPHIQPAVFYAVRHF